MITAMPRIAIVVRDFDRATTAFRDVLGMPVLDLSARAAADLGAQVAMCMPPGGSNVELMSPADTAKPLGRALQKTLDQRGEGPYALMLEAPDPDAEAEVLASRGLDVMPLMPGAAGRDIHPRSTSGVLIRVYPDDSVRNPGGLEGAPPHLSGITRVVVATADAAVAADAYGRGLGLDLGPVSVDEARGVLSAVARPPKGGSIELVSPVDTSRAFAREVERFVKQQHEGMYAFVLEAERPEAAASQLAAAGVAVVGDDGLEVALFGARFLLRARPRA